MWLDIQRILAQEFCASMNPKGSSTDAKLRMLVSVLGHARVQAISS